MGGWVGGWVGGWGLPRGVLELRGGAGWVGMLLCDATHSPLLHLLKDLVFSGWVGGWIGRYVGRWVGG